MSSAPDIPPDLSVADLRHHLKGAAPSAAAASDLANAGAAVIGNLDAVEFGWAPDRGAFVWRPRGAIAWRDGGDTIVKRLAIDLLGAEFSTWVLGRLRSRLQVGRFVRAEEIERSRVAARVNELPHHRGEPIIPVTLDPSRRQAVIEDCPICGEDHRHSALDPALLEGRLSNRASHCHVRGDPGGYYLQLAEGVTVPDELLGWAERELADHEEGST